MPVTVSVRPAAALVAGAVAVLMATSPLSAPAASASPTVGTATEGPLPVSVVVPLIVPPESPAILGAELLAEFTAPNGLLDRQLDTVAPWPVTLAVDPRIPASIRLLGGDAPEDARGWLARLEALPHERFALGYADADTAALAAHDAAGLAAPLGFQFAIDPGRFGPAAEPTPDATESAPPVATPPASPTPDPDDGADPDGPPPLPADEDLVALDVDFENVAWPARGSMQADALEDLAEAGVSTLLLSSAQSAAGADAPHADLGPLDAFVADAELSTLASTAAFAAGIAESGEASADLFQALERQAARSSQPVLIAFDRGTASVPSRLGSVLAGIAGLDGVRLASLAEIAALPATTSALVVPAETPEAEERRSLMGEVVAGVAAESRFASVTVDPTAFRAERRLDLLALASAGWQLRPVGWVESAQAFLDRSREIRRSVQIAEGSDLLVLSPSTGLPVTITNALDVPVKVIVSARPLRPLLRLTGGPVEVTVEPGASHTAYLAAEAVTRGQASVQVTLRSTTGVEIGRPEIVRVDLEPQWETIGVIVLIVLAVVFAAGIVRNIVVRRRASRAVAADGAAAETGDA